jgi:hypothetical protein
VRAALGRQRIATYASGLHYPPSDHRARRSVPDVACDQCVWRGRRRIPRLITEHGFDLPIPDPRRTVVDDCPQMQAEWSLVQSEPFGVRRVTRGGPMKLRWKANPGKGGQCDGRPHVDGLALSCGRPRRHVEFMRVFWKRTPGESASHECGATNEVVKIRGSLDASPRRANEIRAMREELATCRELVRHLQAANDGWRSIVQQLSFERDINAAARDSWKQRAGAYEAALASGAPRDTEKLRRIRTLLIFNIHPDRVPPDDRAALTRAWQSFMPAFDAILSS